MTQCSFHSAHASCPVGMQAVLSDPIFVNLRVPCLFLLICFQFLVQATPNFFFARFLHDPRPNQFLSSSQEPVSSAPITRFFGVVPSPFEADYIYALEYNSVAQYILHHCNLNT